MHGMPDLSLAELYRVWRSQARLFAYQWQDPYLYSAHTYLARSALEFLYNTKSLSKNKVLDFDALPESAQRRYRQCVVRTKQLANANLGWPHAVSRALEQAYARRGKIRHDLLNVRVGLMQTITPPHPSPAIGKEAATPPRQRLPVVSQILRTLLLSPAAQRGSPAKESTLECPPKLKIALESAARIPGKRISRRRVANAHWRYLTDQMAKLRLPMGLDDGTPSTNMSIIRAIEERSKPQDTTVPRRLQKGKKVEPEKQKMHPRYLDKAKQDAVALGVTKSFQRLGRMKRKSGWKHGRTLYSVNHRARRRQWARLLSQTPFFQFSPEEKERSAIHAYTQALSQQAMVSSSRRRLPWRPAREALATAQHIAQQAHLQSKKRSIGLRISPHSLSGGSTRRSARSMVSANEWDWLQGHRS